MKMSERLFKTSIIYFIGQVFTKLISFILLPLYTNYVAVSDFGYYDLAISILGVVVPVVFLEIWTGTLRFSLEKEDDEGKRKVVNNSIIIAGGCAAIYFLLYFVAFIVLRFEQSIYIFLYSVFWVFQLMYLSIARAYGQNALYASSGVISVAVNTFVSIIAVFLLDGDVAALYIGMCASFAVQAVIIDRKTKIVKNFKVSDFDKALCRELIRFSFPLSFNSIINWLLEGCNKLIITGVLGSAANGIYAIGNRLSNVLNLLVSVFILSWQESIFRISNQDEKNRVYNSCINSFTKVVGGCLVLLLPVMKIMFPFLIGTEYREVYGLIPFLLLAIYMNALCSVVSPLFAAEKQTKYSFYTKIVMAATNLIVILSTIGKIGLYSSPIALILANFVGLIVQLLFAKKFVVIKMKKSNIIVFVALYIITCGCYFKGNNLINVIWFGVALIWYVFYLRDFIKDIVGILMSQFKK